MPVATLMTLPLPCRVTAVCLMRRLVSAFVLCAFILTLATDPAEAARKKRQAAAQGPNTKYGSIVIDADTGEVISSDNADKQLHPASLTKMMTLLLVFDAVSERRLRLNDYLRVSSRAAAASPSKLGIKAGGRIRLDDAIKAVAVKSANDMAIVLAEAVSGSEARFSIRMNERAREIGMTRTRFYNASGLHHPGQVSTPRDMAVLGRYILKSYPSFYRYFSLRNFAYAGKLHPNHNKLMNTYAGMDGMKTGYISNSGFNLVASAKRGDRRLIGVVFGGRTSKSRNDHMAELLDKGFRNPRKISPKVDIARLPDLPSAATSAQMSSSMDTQDAVLTPARKPVMLPPAGVTVVDHAPNPGPVMASQPKPTTIDGILGTLEQQPSAAGPSVGQTAAIMSAPSTVPSDTKWAVQIGAYQSRDATDRALYDAVRLLPGDLAATAMPQVAPLKTVESGWLFRARIGNLEADDARRVCTYFRGCLLIPPQH